MIRRYLAILAACLAVYVPGDGPLRAAASAAPAKPDAGKVTPSRAVGKRLELWARPADSPALRAHYQLARSSSLLYEPLQTAGELTFTAPNTLELRDDDPRGATTKLAGETLTIVANDPALPPGPPPAPGGSPGRRWLQARLFALLLARDSAALLADSVISVPRGPGMQLELAPARNHPARRELQRLRVQLDPDTGEVQELQLTETGGDVVTVSLSSHRR